MRFAWRLQSWIVDLRVMQKTEYVITDEQVEELIALCKWRLYLMDETIDTDTERYLIEEAYETLVRFQRAMYGAK